MMILVQTHLFKFPRTCIFFWAWPSAGCCNNLWTIPLCCWISRQLSSWVGPMQTVATVRGMFPLDFLGLRQFSIFFPLASVVSKGSSPKGFPFFCLGPKLPSCLWLVGHHSSLSWLLNSTAGVPGVFPFCWGSVSGVGMGCSGGTESSLSLLRFVGCCEVFLLCLSSSRHCTVFLPCWSSGDSGGILLPCLFLLPFYYAEVGGAPLPYLGFCRGCTGCSFPS